MPFTEQEIGHYRRVVAAIISNDARKKEQVDTCARLQLATVKAALPDADDDTVVTFLVSVAVVAARILAAPLGDVADIVRGVFDNNITAAAHTMGAYDIDSPDIPEFEPESEPAEDKTDIEAELSKIINRQYL